MLVIRFQPRGKKHQPTYRVVVDEKRSKLDGAFVEDLGFYNPHSKEAVISTDRVQYWIGVGAQPSPSVYNLLVSKKIIEGTKLPVHKKSKKAPAAAEAVADKPATAETPNVEEAPKEEATSEAPKPEAVEEESAAE